MADYERNHWLSIRDSGSLGQCLRSRERMLHISKPLTNVRQPDGTIRKEVSNLRGNTLNLGRNAAKRAKRAVRWMR